MQQVLRSEMRRSTFGMSLHSEKALHFYRDLETGRKNISSLGPIREQLKKNKKRLPSKFSLSPNRASVAIDHHRNKKSIKRRRQTREVLKSMPGKLTVSKDPKNVTFTELFERVSKNVISTNPKKSSSKGKKVNFTGNLPAMDKQELSDPRGAQTSRNNSKLEKKKKITSVNQKIQVYMKFNEERIFQNKFAEFQKTTDILDKAIIKNKGLFGKWMDEQLAEWAGTINQEENQKIKQLGVLRRYHILLAFKIQVIISYLSELRRRTMRESISQFTFKSFFEQVKKIILSARSEFLLVYLLEEMGDLFFEVKDYRSSIETYNQFNVCSDIFINWNKLLISYRKLGKTYSEMRDHSEALFCFKAALQLSLYQRKRICELTEYDNIGMQYYYLNEQDKAKKYHTKSMLGLSELKNEKMIGMLKGRIKNGNSYRKKVYKTSSPFFKFELVGFVLKGDHEGNLREVPFLENYVTTIPPLEEGFLFKQQEHLGSKQRLLPPAKKLYKVQYSKEGYKEVLKRSNPTRFHLFKEGFLDLHKESIEPQDLLNLASREPGEVILFTHLSQNKIADTFITNHNFKNLQTEICLEYLDPQMRHRLKDKIGILIKTLERFKKHLIGNN